MTRAVSSVLLGVPAQSPLSGCTRPPPVVTPPPFVPETSTYDDEWGVSSTTTSTTTPRPPQESYPNLPPERPPPQYPEQGVQKPQSCTPGAYLPNNKDCQKFYRCMPDGSPTEQTCHGGLFWNNALSTCDWRDNVKCPTGSADAYSNWGPGSSSGNYRFNFRYKRSAMRRRHRRPYSEKACAEKDHYTQHPDDCQSYIV